MQRPCQTAAEVFVDIRSEKIISFMIHRLEHSSLYSLGVGETTGQAVQWRKNNFVHLLESWVDN